jgi:hippurate hydrolase
MENKTSLKSNLSHKDFNLKKVIEFRQELHSYPELSFKEFNTKERLLTYLKILPTFNNHSKIVETETAGFWVDIYGTNQMTLPQPYLLSLRADMDALPLVEKTGKPYTSKNEGAFHACGHDGHMAILIGTIEYFLLNLEKIPNNFGVRFLFQPAEEIGQGAERMVNSGCLKGVAEIYCLHNYAKYFKAGEIGCCHKAVFAGCDYFNIEIHGKGGHGSTPHLCRNPIIPASMIVVAINQITSQEVNAKETCVVSLGKFVSGTKENIIPDTAQIKGTIRTLNKDTANFIMNRISEITKSISSLYNCECIVEREGYLLPTINHAQTTELLFTISEKYFALTKEHLPLMCSEDFGVYADYVPGCLFLLGGEDEDCDYVIHSSNYDFNDKTLGVGIEVFLRIIEAKSNVQILA